MVALLQFVNLRLHNKTYYLSNNGYEYFLWLNLIFFENFIFLEKKSDLG